MVRIAASVDQARFTPDGRHLVADRALDSGGDVWDVATGEQVTPAASATSFVSLVVTADGRRAVTGGADGLVEVWDLGSGDRVGSLRGHTSPVISIHLGPDDARLATLDLDGVVRVWAFDLDELVAMAHRRVAAAVTPEECRTLLPASVCA